MGGALRILDRRKLGTKLLIGFAGVLAITLALGVQSLLNLRTMRLQAERIYEKELLGISHLKEADINLIRIGRALRQVILAPDAARRERSRRDVLNAEAAVRSEIAAARPAIFRRENLRKLDRFEAYFARYVADAHRVIDMVGAAGFQSNDIAAYVTSGEFTLSADVADAAITDVARSKEASADQTLAEARALHARARLFTLLLLAGGLLLGGMLGYVIAGSIRGPAEELRAAVNELAAGNLVVKVPLTDHPNELGDLARAVEVLQGEARQ